MATDEDLFYILDARQIVGNCAMFWCPGGAGYTCELDKAGKYTRAEAFGKRPTDIPVECAVAEAAAIRHVRVDCPAMEQVAKQAYEAVAAERRTTKRQRR